MQCIVRGNKKTRNVTMFKKKKINTIFNYRKTTNFRLSSCVKVHENSQITSWGEKLRLSSYIHNSEDSFPYWAILLFIETTNAQFNSGFAGTKK